MRTYIMSVKKFRKAASILLCAAMVVGVLASSVMTFAATYDTTQDNSSATGTITLGKTLTWANRQNNPVQSVTYTMERVQAWGNEAVANGTNGTTIAKSSMPMPTAGSGITVSGDTATITIPISGTGGTATGTKDVPITFTQAGYYVYRIKETPLSSITGATVTSDTHEYFAVYYVANNQQKTASGGNAVGDTITGVYVHDITSWRNEANGTTMPDLSDIANVTENGGNPASTNNESNLAKVGKSDPSTPNRLEAYKMWNNVNYAAPVDLSITKNVTGSLGDLTKKFQYTVSLTGLEANGQYTVNLTGSPTITMATNKGTYSSNKITANASGEAQFTLLLADGQGFKINDVPNGTTWSVTEAANNHKASVVVSPKTSVAGQTGTGSYTKANSADSTALAVNGTLAADTTAAFTNERNITTVTGLSTEVLAPIVALAIIAMMAGAFMIRKRNREDEEYIEACERAGK